MTWLDRLKQVLGLGPGEIAEARQSIGLLSCDEVAGFLYEYIDQELDAGTRTRVQEHLEMDSCDCNRLLLFELAFLDRVRRSNAPPAPDGVRTKILARLELEARG